MKSKISCLNDLQNSVDYCSTFQNSLLEFTAFDHETYWHVQQDNASFRVSGVIGTRFREKLLTLLTGRQVLLI